MAGGKSTAQKATVSPWLTPQEAADYLQVSAETIRRACRSKGLRYVKVGHSTVRIRREWLDAWMDDRTRQNTDARSLQRA